MSYPPGAKYDSRAPWNDTSPDPDFELTDVRWYSEKGLLDVECKLFGGSFDFVIEQESEEFFSLMDNLQDGDYKYMDDEGIVPARIDGFFNFHVLIQSDDEHVHHRVINLNKALEWIADEKYNNQFI